MPHIIKLADIDASDRLRPIDEAQRDLIAASIEEKGGGKPGEGLDTPFKIAPDGDKWRLVTGGHRHSALIVLGWTDVEVGRHVVIDEALDEIDARIAEIDENLCRHELNPLDRALFIAKRRELCAQRRQEHGGDRKSAKFKEQIKSASCQLDLPPRFTVEVAERVGLSERVIRRDLRIAEKLDPQAIAALRGTKVERNQQQLLALCDMVPAEQRAIAKLIGKGEAKTPSEARIVIGLDKPVVVDPQTRILAALGECWERADKVTRATFLKEIGAALVKNGAA